MGLFLYQSSLTSDRPGDVQLGESALAGPQVLARLWEDPFEAVVRHQDSESGGSKSPSHEHSLTTLRQQLGGDPRSITVMAVLVESDPYAEGKEQRLRKRYAVLSALGEAGYVPIDGEHIDYFLSGKDIHVPYEWYESNTPKGATGSLTNGKVLLLWLPDDWTYHLPETPRCQASSNRQDGFLHDMANLMCDLRPSPQKGGSPRLRILGPGGSGMVRQWVKEAIRLHTNSSPGSADYVKDYLADAAIYSYSATAHPALLYSAKEGPPIFDTKAEADTFGALGIRFERTLGTDRELAEALVEELQHRDVEIPKGTANEDLQDHIALIAEWDTFYGRALPFTFVAAALEKAGGQSFPDRVKTSQTQLKGSDSTPAAPGSRQWIHSYVYLRGLDGVASGKTTSAGTTKKDSENSGHEKQQNRLDTAYLERPEGQSQFDYIRRLTMSIERDNEQLKREGKHFRAIGILGSDVYDKLLILQALRKSFSNVTFFTTDLDARVMHPDAFDWSRNLIVASAYGLELNPDWQGGTPPFRSSYQTALFLSTLKALDISVPLSSTADDVQLYEIGRRGAVTLPRGSALQVALDRLRHGGWIPTEQPGATPVQTVHPSPSPVLATPSTLIRALFVPSLLVCMVVMIGRRYHTPAGQFSSWNIFRCLSGSLFLAVLLYVFMHVQLEPFSLFDGVSIWPTELLRLLVILLSLYFLRQSKSVLMEGDRQIAVRFQLATHSVEPHRAQISQWWKPWKDFWDYSAKAQTGMKNPEAPTPIEMTSLWNDYLCESRWSKRVVRVVWLMGFALALASVVMSLFDSPFVPARGAVSQWADRAVLWFAILLTSALLFVVLDASLLAARTIRQSIEGVIVWPSAALQAGGENLTPGPDLHARLTIRFIGMLTSVVGKLIYYPFIAVALLIAARSRYFDGWDFPVGLLLVFGMNLAYALASALILQSVAERARITALARVHEQLVRVTGTQESTERETKRIQSTVEEIEDTREGAFASFLYQPAFGASLIPTSGITLLAVLEYFVPGK
ncbi:MAG: hypothetical protein OEW13_00030 [Nitrospira sp.]|nr:hypothetical protein [Nitrospira sp.]